MARLSSVGGPASRGIAVTIRQPPQRFGSGLGLETSRQPTACVKRPVVPVVMGSARRGTARRPLMYWSQWEPAQSA
jgi:hypothetical protein